jgi:hypothetical protein
VAGGKSLASFACPPLVPKLYPPEASAELTTGRLSYVWRARGGGNTPTPHPPDERNFNMAMAGNIRVTPEQLQSIAGQLNSGASNIESINSQLQSQVAPLGSDWAGVAHGSFP